MSAGRRRWSGAAVTALRSNALLSNAPEGVTPVEWSSRAACLSAEPEVFFPVGSGGAALDEVSAAKRICAVCAVQPDCRDYALRTRQPFGVWGGLDEDERRMLLLQAVPSGA